MPQTFIEFHTWTDVDRARYASVKSQMCSEYDVYVQDDERNQVRVLIKDKLFESFTDEQILLLDACYRKENNCYVLFDRLMTVEEVIKVSRISKKVIDFAAREKMLRRIGRNDPEDTRRNYFEHTVRALVARNRESEDRITIMRESIQFLYVLLFFVFVSFGAVIYLRA